MTEPPTPRRRRTTRLAVRALLVVVVLCALGAFLATRSFALRAVVVPRLADALGADVSIGRASLSGPFTLTLRQVVAEARGVPGDASRVLAVDRLDARIDWLDAARGRFGVREVRFDRPTLRLSKRTGSPEMNLAALTPRQRGSGPLRLPHIDVRSGRVEFGEHDERGFTALASIEVDGVLDRDAQDGPRYTIALVESTRSAEARAPRNPSPITLEGWYDPLSVEGRLVLENVELSSWGPAAAPSDVRDLWRRLQLAGEVERTEFVYSDASGVSAEFHFSEVALELPIAADPQADVEMRPGPRADPERFMQISGARGVARLSDDGLRASVAGLIEDLPYEVEFETSSLRLDTGFTIRFDTAEPFQVAERPQLLPFAPRVVRKTLASFSSPTALMEASVVVTRAESTPESQRDLSIEGVMTFTEGTASFADFPYRVRDIAARVRFDDEAVVIEEMTGAGPTGARMSVTGIIAPPTDGAMVDLRIRFRDVPLDDAFDAAMPESCEGLLSGIFSRDAERRLRDAGLLPDDFVVGGVGSLDISVRRARGDDSPYVWDATFTLPEAGLLVERFPYPATVRHATIEVNSDAAEVRIAEVRGVSGGEGDLVARIALRERGEAVFVPTIMLRTRATPLSDALLAAIPGGLATARDEPAQGEPARLNASEAIRALGLRGEADAIARVLPRDDGSIGFDVFLEFNSVSSTPSGQGSPLLRDIGGRLSVSESFVELTSVRGLLAGRPLSLDGTVGLREGALGSLDLRIDAERIDLSMPFESLAAPFAPDGARAIRDAIEARGVRGQTGAKVRLASRDPNEGGVRAVVEPHSVLSLAFDALGGRVTVSDLQGEASLEADGAGGILASFRDASMLASFGDDEPTRVALDGRFEAGRKAQDDGLENAPPTELRASADLRWPSALATALTRAVAPDRADGFQGALDAWGLRLWGSVEALVRTRSGSPPEIADAKLLPSRLSLARDGQALDLRIESGEVRRDADGVRFEGLAFREEGLSIDVSGAARLASPPSIDLSLRGEAISLGERVLAFLPAGAGAALRSAAFGADRVVVEDAHVVVSGERRDTLMKSSMRFEGASFRVGGVEVSSVDGRLDAEIDSSDARPLDAELRFDSAHVARLALGRGAARLVAVDSGNAFLVPSFEADAYSGRVFGVAKLVRSPGVASSARQLEYQVEAQLSGLSLAGLRADLGLAEGEAPEREGAAAGQIDATIGVAGTAGQPASRVGRGSARVWGGAFLRLPLLSRLIELSNLQLPTGQSLDFAHARFFMEGDTITFEELGVSSDSVSLRGQGSLRWPSLAMDIRVTSRAARRAPLLSDLLEAFRDELVTTRVTGTPSDPRYSVESLPTTRRFLDSIFGRRNDADARVRPPARQVRQIERSDDDR